MKKNAYKNIFDLKGRTAVVTGGVGILGKHFCEGLASFGAHVVVVDQLERDCSKFAVFLAKKYRAKALGIGCDVSSPLSVKAMVRRIVDEFGGIHILHNNAATKTDDLKAFFASTENYSLEEWRKVMAVNLDGMFLVAQAVGKQMTKQKTGGSIIQTASIYGVMAPDQRIYKGSRYQGRPINTPAVYSASKAGVVGLTKYLAAYWAAKNIRVNALVPGGVESGQNKVFSRKYSARVPMGRMARADEMVGALIFLASDASNYVTGHVLMVDGGLHVW
ncbi:MAG: short-chain dehydrogenase [Omnitrophica bacterium RIFOXYB12_FULL_50_7]|nr:MAG: short-chain dehydrogenase [Omnitrophica bacterium RIFOXYB12_FULL_50_7]